MLMMYQSHPMELGEGLIAGSGARAFELRALLPEIEHWIPEENQAKETSKQQKIDLDALQKADILLVDFYHYGLDIEGKVVMGKGTNQEVGFIKGLNRVRAKKVSIIQIIRQTVHFHPFDVGESVTNVASLQDAVDYIRKYYVKK